MTYPEALAFLGSARFFGMKPGLERMRQLAAALGEPQQSLRFIHIAGTNGKGSTAAFCEAGLRASGFCTGLYTSPHLVSVRERIQVNRQAVSESEFAEGMEVVRRAVAVPGNEEATFFEIMTALALWHFAQAKVDFVVWETGLGGRLDATNIVEPEVCIITNIGLDHQQYLGRTRREIAGEKAGIIKPRVPVVTAVTDEEAWQVMAARAEELNSPITRLGEETHFSNLGIVKGSQRARMDIGPKQREVTLGLIGAHQAQNAVCAVAAVERLWKVHPAITEDTLSRGLAETHWPGRFEVLQEKPLIVLDGAHNAEGAASLAETWRAFLRDRLGRSVEVDGRAHLFFAAVADKDVSSMAELLRPLAQRVSLVQLANERSADPAVLARAFAELPCAIYNSVTDAWQNLAAADPEQPVLITGSLFLVGEMLARQQGHAEEYRLNERLEKTSASR